MSRALYLVSELFLNEGSCSSSTIISPNFGIFKNIDDLVPMIISTSQFCIKFQFVNFFLGVSEE